MATKKKTTKRSSKPAAKKPLTKEQEGARQQINALLLLVASILMFCLAVIQGENLWTWLHNVLLGLFSFSAFIIPVLLAFVSIMLALEKDVASIQTRMWQSGLFALLLNSTIYSFSVNSANHSFGDAIARCFEEGQLYRGSGVIGVLLG